MHLWLLSSSSHSSFSAAEQMIETLRPGSSGSSGSSGGGGGGGGSGGGGGGCGGGALVQVRLSGSGILGGVAASARHAIIGDAQIHPQYDPNVDEVASRLLLPPASTRPRSYPPLLRPATAYMRASPPVGAHAPPLSPRDATLQVASRLPEGREAMCVVPLRDHFGRVIGLLQVLPPLASPRLPSPPLPSAPRRPRVLPWRTTARLRLPGWLADVR